MSLAVLGIAGMTTACTDKIEIGYVDESLYADIDKVHGYVRDMTSGKSESVVELYADDYNTSVVLGLTKVPGQGVDIQFEYDSEYAAEYNSVHGTDFQLLPESSMTIEDGGRIVLAPDDKLSYELDLGIAYDESLEDDRTYILPIKATSLTDGVSLPESSSHLVYLVRNFRNKSDCDKGPDAVKTFLYYGYNPLNIHEFVLEDGKLFFDVVVLFGVNINYNADAGNIYISLNSNLTHLLDNNETYLQPLRKRGVKILLGLLGNHDESGLAQLSDAGAAEFASQLKKMVDAYNLDGVNFDDEYSKSPDLSNPLFAPWSDEAGARLCYETKLRMPDKLVTVYDFGRMYGIEEVDGVPVENWIDIVVADYGMKARPIGGLTLKNCSGASTELVLWRGPSTEAAARQVREDGYGYYMMFDLYAGEESNFGRQVEALKRIARGLYDKELLTPKYYYARGTMEPVPYTYSD